ncbi:pyridoxal-phosphate-dependent aminotransferase family protein [Ulvibacter litoralis]|uniref:Alanine-glyoxylate transaminase / serine-glyoxylate transaminase / serine-pyruvate transaminase n=1 Tax=Ulvibacter litoralis TaxID=227084 RepID=A0A1G7C8R7_9FLAO|nr:alanine--glyoxylate aminotransferase family protein [Ulvibacter litoralis]GHC48404.1 aminotransferase class V-fold PLP-dependent enzyme [Ulvibacter litoralis]SDE35140.1 alanine-glyoxylate transaminase / serine-glyoxylate transaminase / serine-pyruvate transaminase [Ulvibacter litoralis]
MKGRKLLMIPGPIEFEPEVTRAMGIETTSHVAPDFIESFGNALDLMKDVWKAPAGQPFVVAGSGTLAMDMAAANLIEAGDHALVISTGYFGKRYRDILLRYGAKVTVLSAAIGDVISLEEIEEELKQKQYKLLTFTHVDTSTGVLVAPEPIALLAQKYKVLSVMDGVCSVAGEAIKQDDWGLDVVLTASQKAVGVPPGLALLVASERALQTWKNRKTLVPNYYADWGNWLPIMKAYQERKPSYFGTPPVNLILALETSLKIITSEGIQKRIAKHMRLATAFRLAVASIGLKILPKNEDYAANTLTAVYYPIGVQDAEFRKAMSDRDIIVAGGLLPEIKTTYFRVGHMGSVSEKDLVATLSAIEYALSQTGYAFEIGTTLKTFQQKLQ